MQHIISVIQQHGLLIVFLNVLLAQSGLPLPAFPTLMAAGGPHEQRPRIRALVPLDDALELLAQYPGEA